MSPFDAATLAAPTMTSDTPGKSSDAWPLSASQIALLVKTVVQALRRGQSVAVTSEGRVLARYLPTGVGEEPADRPSRRK